MQSVDFCFFVDNKRYFDPKLLFYESKVLTPVTSLVVNLFGTVRFAFSISCFKLFIKPDFFENVFLKEMVMN